MLVGEQINLRPVQAEDLSLLVEWRNRPSIWDGFFNKFPLSNANQLTWLSSLNANQSKLLFVICVNGNQEPIGTVGFDHIDFPNQCAEFGSLLIGKDGATGRGYALEACQLVLEYGFFRLNMNRVFLYVYANNGDAIKVYERCGFRAEGTLREAQFDRGQFADVLAMGMLRREFAPTIRPTR